MSDLRSILFLDIETVSQYASYDDVPLEVSTLWNAKLRYKIEQGEEPSELYERYGGIMAEFGKVVCISVGRVNADHHLDIKSISGDNESDLLKKFVEGLQQMPSNIRFCSHNGKEFDWPYLCRRMMIHKIHLPIQLQLQNKKPWEVQHIDTMEMWKFGDRKNYTSLSLLATILGIETADTTIDGSKVGQMYWKDQDIDAIISYCEDDVRLLYLVYIHLSTYGYER